MNTSTSYYEEFSGSNSTFPVANWSIGVPTSDQDEHEELLSIITYVGATISIAGILLTLFSYFGYRKFRVKRTHIVVVNLCLCLLVYFVSYMISNSARQHSTQTMHKDHSGICITGAFLCQLALLSTWFWIGTYWVLLLVMYKRPLGGHISHFFLKSALPSYGIPVLISIVSIVIAKVRGDLDNEHIYFSDRCFVDYNYLYIGLLIPFVLVAIPIIVMFTYLLKGVSCSKSEQSKQRNLRRVKGHMLKLTSITVVVAISIFLSTVIIPSLRTKGATVNLVSVICFTAGSTALGLLLMFLFCFYQKEIRGYWSSILTGNQDNLHHRTMSRGKSEGFGIYRSSRSRDSKGKVSNGSNPLEDPDRKSSTIRMQPKDDTDMSTLGLIQIPGTPSPRRERKRSTATNGGQQQPDERGNLEVIDEGSSLQTPSQAAQGRSSRILKPREGKKSRSESASSTDSKQSYSKRQKSMENILGGKSRRKESKRRSASTSSLKQDSVQILVTRQSVASIDSTEMTNFE